MYILLSPSGGDQRECVHLLQRVDGLLPLLHLRLLPGRGALEPLQHRLVPGHKLINTSVSDPDPHKDMPPGPDPGGKKT